jgi:YidC/Oxa1 family membrane protein insertase
MMFLPLVFVLFVFRFPAGVLVYWITTNFWTMGQQYVVRKRVGPRMAVAGVGDVEGTATASKPKGSGPRSGPTATKALPKATADTAKGNGEKAAAAGGIAALFRGRGQAAQVVDKTDVATNGTSGSSPKSESKSDSPARAPSSASKTRSRPGSNRASAKASGPAKGSGGSTKASGGSTKASGTAKSSGNGSADSSSPVDGAKPPPPPRKRKKRSGRRR